MTGVWLLLAHPELPTCADCRAWLHDKDWRVSRRAGRPVPRPPGTPLPCPRCPKSEDGRPNPGAELSAKNARAYHLALAARAGAAVAADPIVERNLALVQSAADQYERGRERLLTLLAGRR